MNKLLHSPMALFFLALAVIVAVMLVGPAVKREGYAFIPGLAMALALGIALSATLLPRVPPLRPSAIEPPADARCSAAPSSGAS